MSRRLGHTQGPRAQLPDLAVPATAGQLSIRCLSVLGHNWATSGPHLGHIFTCMEASDSCVTGSVRVALALSAGVPHGTLGPARRPLPATSCGHITAASATGSGGTAHPPVSPPSQAASGSLWPLPCREAAQHWNRNTKRQSAREPRPRGSATLSWVPGAHSCRARDTASGRPPRPRSQTLTVNPPPNLGAEEAQASPSRGRARAPVNALQKPRGAARENSAVCVLPQREGHSL